MGSNPAVHFLTLTLVSTHDPNYILYHSANTWEKGKNRQFFPANVMNFEFYVCSHNVTDIF